MRIVGSVLALLVLSVAPTYSNSVQSTARQRAEDAYDALQAKLSQANSLQTTLEVRMLGETERYAFRFLRKNFAKALSKSAAIFQNGKFYYDFSPLDNEYWQKSAPATGLPAGTAFSLGGVVGLESMGFSNEPKLEPLSLSSQKWDGFDVDAIAMQSVTDAGLKATLYLDPNSKLPVGWDYSVRGFKSSGRFRDFRLDVPMKPADFAWSPPKGAKKIRIG